MNIGIAGPFNPSEFSEYFEKEVNLPQINLTASSVNAYVLGLLKRGHKVTIFTTYAFEGEPYYIEGNNIKVWFASTVFKIHALGRARAAKRIRRIIEKDIESISVLHAEWTYEFALATTYFGKKIPIYCSVRDWCPYLLKLSHGFMGRYYWIQSYYIFKAVMKNEELKLIANSDYTKKQILSMYPSKNVTIIPNPIKSSLIIDNRLKKVNETIFISICASLHDVRKNICKLLEAFKKYLNYDDQAKLYLVGAFSESWKNDMRDKNLLHNVELVGQVDHNKVIDLIDNSTCLVHPSIEETFGNILLEAMSRCIPCIGGANAGAVPQVLGFGKYGILCDVEDENRIYEAMLKIKDQELISKIVLDSNEYLKKTYTEEAIADAHIHLFTSDLNP